MYKDHPIITKLSEIINMTEHFHFTPFNEFNISEKIMGLDKKNTTTRNGIPSKILVDNCDIITPFLTNMSIDSNLNMNFPNPLKLADITLTHKKDDTTKKYIDQ